MTIKQLLCQKWHVAVGIGLLLLGAVACVPFGQQAAATATLPPPPTETPLPSLPTFTPTAAPTMPKPTVTPVAAVAEEKPTLTPTPQQEQPPVGGGEPDERAVVPVTYKVTTVPTFGNVVQNSSFEDGFDDNGVGTGWSTFDNGDAVYDWVEDIQPAHVSHGQIAQLMRIMGPGKADRVVGIYQTVDVIPGETYTLTMHGIIQSSTAGTHKTPYGHRVQWAIDDQGRGDWNQIEWGDWSDTGWNDVKLKEANPTMNVFAKHIVPKTDKLTLFIRGWTKWPILGSEAKFYIDGVFLHGPVPGTEKTITVMTSGGDGEINNEMPTTGAGGVAAWIPITGGILVLGFALYEVRKAWAR